MAEKSSAGRPLSGTALANKPVAMRLFGGWEIDKTPSNCIPRLCSLNITRLALCKPFGADVTTIMIAVKMQSSKRTLRSNEISVPNFNNESNSGVVELDLTFSLQYPHFLKRSGNQLQIMVQRRKRYKNRAILGFKTLAFGVINMAEVLQRSANVEKELDLISNMKELAKNEVIAKILVSALKSLPVDQEIRPLKVTLQSADVYSDEDEFASNEDGSDSETVEDGPTAGTHSTSLSARNRRNARKARKLFADRQDSGSDPNAQQRNDRNFKQKFIALLKKFRLPDSEAFDSEEQYQAAIEQQLMASRNSNEIEDLFEEEEEDIDDLSDSGQDFDDDISISSTPKPSLRPYFSSGTLFGPESESLNGETKKRVEYDSQENSGPEQTPDTSDTSLKHTPNKEPIGGHKRPVGSAEKEKREKQIQRERDKQNPSGNKDKDLMSSKTKNWTFWQKR